MPISFRNSCIKNISILNMLLFPFVGLTVLAVALVGYISYRNGQQSVNEVTSHLRTEIDRRIIEHLTEFLGTPHRINNSNAFAIKRGAIDVAVQATLEQHFWEQIQLFPSVTSINFSNTLGGLVNAGREGAEGAIYTIVTNGFEKGLFHKYGIDNHGRRAKLLDTIPDFDGRTRSWYIDAVEQGSDVWSETYVLFTGQDMCITASRPVYDAKRELLGVTAVNLFLSHISGFMSGIDIGKTGQSFIIERSGLLIATSTGEKPFNVSDGDLSPRRIAAVESADIITRSAAEALAKKFNDYHNISLTSRFDFRLDGQRQLGHATPFNDPHGIDWLIISVIPETDFMADIRANNRTTLFLILVIVLLIVAISFLITRKIIVPISNLKAFSQTISEGKLDQTFDYKSRISEIGALASSFNYMIKKLKQAFEELNYEISERKQAEKEREKLQAQLTRAQKMEAIGTLAGGIAHNFNNILMGIQGRASLMIIDKAPCSPDHEHLKSITEYVKNAVWLTNELLGFARGGKYEVKPTDLNELIKNESRMFSQTKKEIRVRDKYEKDLWPVEVDQGQIRQALLNLYVNAWQAMPGGGDLYVQTENVTLGQECVKPFEVAPGRYVKISVSDTGIGMDDATLEKVFDPFFSTKEIGQGSGLGLASVYGIIKNHGGFINVYSEKGTGSIFTIYLPASEKEAVEEPRGIDRHEIQYGSGTVLLVDDEDMIVNVGQQMLERLGYQVLTAKSGWQALDIYKDREKDIDLVIMDMIMPGMGGGEAHDLLKEIDPNVKVLLSSGYSINGQAQDILDRGCLGFIQKPFTMGELSRKVKKTLNR